MTASITIGSKVSVTGFTPNPKLPYKYQQHERDYIDGFRDRAGVVVRQDADDLHPVTVQFQEVTGGQRRVRFAYTEITTR